MGDGRPVAFVTGASRGIGSAIAVRLPGNWHILIAGLTVSGAGALFGDPEDTA